MVDTLYKRSVRTAELYSDSKLVYSSVVRTRNARSLSSIKIPGELAPRILIEEF